jgi:hypothetical protein
VTSAIEWQGSAVTVKLWFEPQPTATGPLGEIEPPAPADAFTVNVFRMNDAAIVWSFWTLVKV